MRSASTRWLAAGACGAVRRGSADSFTSATCDDGETHSRYNRAKKGLRQGQQEGRLEGEHRALFKVLKARGLTVDDTARRRIMACTELAQLELWLGKAVTVQSVQELFKHKLTARPAARTTGSHGRSVKARKPRARR